MPENTAAINTRLQKLRGIFTLSLPARFTSIDVLWEKVKQQGLINSDDANELCRAVHTLAGSAGTFGQHQLGEVARDLEQTLHRVLSINERETFTKINAIESKLLTLKSSVNEQAVANNTSPPIPSFYGNGGGINIALLEDDVILAKEIAEQLVIYGYRVHCYINLAEFSDAVANQTFSAVLADVELTEGSLTSPELAARFIAICPSDLPIILISVREDWLARLSAVRIGAVAYFKKPVDCGVLANRLSQLINPEQKEKTRVLIIDDEIVLAEHYAETLRQASMIVEILDQPANVIPAISRLRPDLILMDLYMPVCTGLELTSIIRQIEAYQGIPIVFLSTEPVKEKQHNAMFLGGDDFLQKPISDTDLVYAVSHRAERFKSLNALMVRDSLTGLLNHATLKSQLETLQARAVRKHSNLCFIMIDIDLFKAINDRYGHPKGDVVIRSLAHLLQKRLRTSDIVGRYGGEEFAVILPDTELTSAFEIIDDLRTNFEKITHYHEDSVFNATFSAGLAATTSQCCSMQDLIDQADQALYIAKHQGRNRIAML